MKIERQNLISTAEKIGIPNHLSEKLWSELNKEIPSQFDFAKILYYIGALIVMSAMSWFMADAFVSYSPKIVFLISSAYLILFFLLGSFFWHKKLQIPGGLFITVSVCMVPLVIYSLQKWMGFAHLESPEKYTNFFKWVKSEWLFMEIGTVIFGAIAFYFYRFPFLMMPIFGALWYMSMDISPLLFGEENNFEIFQITSIVFGVCLLFVAYFIDINSKKDFAFWPYLFGILTFWGGLSLLETSSEYKRFLYLMINIGLVLLSILLQRTVFLIFGGLGIFIYIATLFYKYFSDSAVFPILLSFIGVLVVLLGILYHKNHIKIEKFFLDLVPKNLTKWLPRR